MLNKLCLPQWSIILITLYHVAGPYSYCQKLYREVDTASSHIRRILSLMEINGFIMRKKDGRIKHIELTLKGRQVAEDVIKLKEDMNKTPVLFQTK